MIGINPPIGVLKDLPDLLKMSLHDQEVEMCQLVLCTACNKTVSSADENNDCQLDRDHIHQDLLIQVVPKLNDNND
jgi:hypothetical protein